MMDPTLNQNLESDEIHHGNFDRDSDLVLVHLPVALVCIVRMVRFVIITPVVVFRIDHNPN